MNRSNLKYAGAITAALVASAALWEGTRYDPYYDIVGVLTVCQGYTGKDIVKGKRYSPAECKAFLEKELKVHQAGVLKCVNVPLKQHQIDAYTLFAYNVGVNAFCTSKSVLEPLNRGNTQAACDGLLKWAYAKGKFVQGLYNRRVYERKMCLGELNVEQVPIAFDYTDFHYRWVVRDPYAQGEIRSRASEG
jgi:lysozyme